MTRSLPLAAGLTAALALMFVALGRAQPHPVLATSGAIRVAVEKGPSATNSAAALAAQLNDDTFFNFTATVVDASQIDTPAELANYDVVVLGDSGFNDNDFTTAMATALRDWVQNQGGGVVTVGWMDFAVRNNQPRDGILDDIMPIDASPDGNNIFCDNPATINFTGTSSPITSGLTDFTLPTSDDVEYSPFPPDATNGQVLATVSSSSCQTGQPRNVVVSGTLGTGRIAYLGLLYIADVSYNVGDLRTGQPDRLLEQAVAWASQGIPPTPTPTPTRTASPIPTATPTHASGAGGAAAVVAVAGAGEKNRERAAGESGTQPPPASPAPSTGTGRITAPNTGDAGLAAPSADRARLPGLAAALGFIAVAGLALGTRVRRPR